MSMTKPDPIVVTRTLIKREWADIEPKIAVALASGAVADGLVNIINAYGIELPVAVLSGIPLFCSLLAGWITPSVGTTTTIRHGNDFVVEKHSGNVEIKTGAIPIQRQRDAAPNSASASAGYVAPTLDVGPYANNGPIGSFQSSEQESPPVEPKNPTQGFTAVISPDRARADAFVSHLPSSSGIPAAVHDDDSDDDSSQYTGHNWGN